MGFRSTIITEHYGHNVPSWFVEKYPWLSFGTSHDGQDSSPCLLISSKREAKFYAPVAEEDVFVDIQKILCAENIKELVAVLLHECGGITRVSIKQNSITAQEPTAWKSVTFVEHYYCNGCSDDGALLKTAKA